MCYACHPSIGWSAGMPPQENFGFAIEVDSGGFWEVSHYHRTGLCSACA